MPEVTTEVKKRKKAPEAAVAKKTKVVKASKTAEAKPNGKAKKVNGEARLEKTPRAPRTVEGDSRKIKLLVKDNPKREGSNAYSTFELYRTSKTIAEFLAAGGSRVALKYDEERGFIELV